MIGISLINIGISPIVLKSLITDWVVFWMSYNNESWSSRRFYLHKNLSENLGWNSLRHYYLQNRSQVLCYNHILFFLIWYHCIVIQNRPTVSFFDWCNIPICSVIWSIWNTNVLKTSSFITLPVMCLNVIC